uniref:hypothetical protein n=1 Tax=Acinetobacter sp. YH16051 TaxID=2601190 RepID=UPI001C555B88
NDFYFEIWSYNVTTPKDQVPPKEPVKKPMPDYQPRPLRNVNESNVGNGYSPTILNEDKSGRK